MFKQALCLNKYIVTTTTTTSILSRRSNLLKSLVSPSSSSSSSTTTKQSPLNISNRGISNHSTPVTIFTYIQKPSYIQLPTTTTTTTTSSHTRYFSTDNNKHNNDSHNNNNDQQQQQQQQQRKSNKEYSEELKEKNKNLGMWVLASIIGVLGLSYAAVPLYRMFCRVTGYGGTVRESTHDLEAEAKKRNLKRDLYPIKVTFTSSIGNKIPWTFRPVQSSIEVIPGEPVLAFYRATNHTDKPIIGVATYNITPMKAGSYFTKIQCFCFDEQRIKPNETIDMPVLFVVEPEMLDDKNMKGITDITLSYTFFKSNDQGELEEI